MKASIDLKLDGHVLENGSLLVNLYIVKAFMNDSCECVSLSYHIDSEVADHECKFYKDCYSDMYHGFWVDCTHFISL